MRHVLLDLWGAGPDSAPPGSPPRSRSVIWIAVVAGVAVIAAIVLATILMTRNTGDSAADPTSTTRSAAAVPSVPAEPSRSGSAMSSGSSADLSQGIGVEFSGALDPAPGVTAVHASAVGSDSIDIGDLITSSQQERDISVWPMETPDGDQFWLTRFVGYEDTVPFYRVTDVAAA